MALIRLLIVVLGVYLLYWIVMRVLLPFAARYFMRKASENFQEKMKQKEDGKKVYQDEKVTIRKASPKSDGNNRTDDGEYVDFEEV